MKLEAALICFCSAILFLCLFVIITPIVSSAGYSEYQFTPAVSAILLIGAFLIMTACVVLIKRRKGSRNSN
jgi:peptidoglycan/LPS O-acetylase OafA/YrhL